MAFITTAIVPILATVFLADIRATSPQILTRQKRAWIVDSFSIEEEHKGPFPYDIGRIELERSYSVLFHLRGSGVDKEPKGLLSIDRKTGVVSVTRSIDYEEYKELKLAFEAINVSNKALDTKLGVEIKILDINDNPPKFQKAEYEITVKESQLQGTFLLTVLAIDNDKAGTSNSTIDYRIVSVTPVTNNVEFFMEGNGKISFKGCFDYEKAQRYTIVVEGKDRGEVISLSSTCKVIVHIEDENNNLPVFTSHMVSGTVKERETLKSVLRTQVSDKDTTGTPAWKAKYTLHGDTGHNFQIETDPVTNYGILSVIKPLDFEDGALKNVTISVENEAPYFSCVVKNRAVQGLWITTYTEDSPEKGDVPKPQQQISVIVEDVNDPPEFLYPVRDIIVEENTEIGYLLETFTAVDKDTTFVSDFVYVKGYDPGHLVTVDPKTGKITTAKVLDRESEYVINNTYKVIVYAVDKGVPPMTGTATLSIHLIDQNDNVPHLTVNVLDMCLANGPSVANITAYDRDGDPYAGPFRFELLGDVKDQWKLDPYFGTTVQLVKEKMVYAGFHDLVLKISDMQDQSSVQNLSVNVCDCSTTKNCRGRRLTSVAPGPGVFVIMFGSCLLLLVLLLMIFFCDCGREKAVELDPGPEDYLLKSNIETPGTDCKVPESLKIIHKEVATNLATSANPGIFQQTEHKRDIWSKRSVSSHRSFSSRSMLEGYRYQNRGYQKYATRSHSLMDHYKGMALRNKYSSIRDQKYIGNKADLTLPFITQRVSSIQSKELMDYSPHVYADEGSLVIDPNLDAISIVEVEFDPNELLYLGPRFNTLAGLCKPEPAPRAKDIKKLHDDRSATLMVTDNRK